MSDCIIWTKGKSMGYGTVMREGKKIRAHQAAWLDAGNELVPGTNLHHVCGERLCINAEHLQQMSLAEHARLHVQAKPICPDCGGPRRYMEHRREYRCSPCSNAKRWERRKLLRSIGSATSSGGLPTL
jgi:tRNA(Ile2) C34 agmatinyltransferase TiaS